MFHLLIHYGQLVPFRQQLFSTNVYLKGARVRNCVEKDVVITVDKCLKERRNKNSRRLMTPSISFYTSCDVTKHQPSFLFRAFDAYSRVKSVHLERHPFSPAISCVYARLLCVRLRCESMLAYVYVKTTDIKRAYRTWNPSEFPEEGTRNEKLMACLSF